MYDPSDLPGGSIDPLGFERGYLFLADKILPGMTNVANCPRYFGMMCAGVSLVPEDIGKPPKELAAQRRDTLLRFERFWALANVLAVGPDGDDELSGMRGITYAKKHASWLIEKGLSESDSRFPLLTRQERYGAIGMYGVVAETGRLWYRKDFELTRALGERLAHAFIKETNTPKRVVDAALEDLSVPLSILEQWGERSKLWGTPGRGEAQCIQEILNCDSTRSRFADAFDRARMGVDETELEFLERLLRDLSKTLELQDLAESVACILRYEECYRWALLAFERVLFLCKASPAGTCDLSSLDRDPVIETVRSALPAFVGKLGHTLGEAETERFRGGLDKLRDVRDFLESVARGCATGSGLVEPILTRHIEVQHGKFDRGRRKMPWVDQRSGTLALTIANVALGKTPLETPDQISPHPYRLSALKAWIQAGRGA